MNLSHFFIDRPIFATVLSVFVILLGGAAYFTLPVAQYPEIAPPTIVVSASYPGASAEVVSDTVSTPLEQEINGVENMLYMNSPGDRRRQSAAHRHLRARHRPRYRAGAGAEPRRDRAAEAARRGAAARRHGQEELARHADGDPPELAGRLARPALHLELRNAAGQGRAVPARWRRRRADLRRARLCDAHLARPRQGRGAQPDGRRGRQRAPGAERPGRLGRAQSAADRQSGRLPAQCRDAGAAHRPTTVRQHHRSE